MAGVFNRTQQNRKRYYRSVSCEDCPLKSSCTKAAGNREVTVSTEALRYRNRARELLRSEEGYALAVRRLPTVTLEVGWRSLVHNLLKQAAWDQKRKLASLQ